MSAPIGNKFALGLDNSGRPPMYESSDQLFSKVNEYFEYCVSNKEKITITGLALYLGFESRQSIYDYAEKKEFSYVIKRAQLVVENSYESNGQTIDIFALKNMGWVDRQEIDHSGEIGTYDTTESRAQLAKRIAAITNGSSEGESLSHT